MLYEAESTRAVSAILSWLCATASLEKPIVMFAVHGRNC